MVISLGMKLNGLLQFLHCMKVYLPSLDNKLKVSVPDEDDPTYQRISSLIPDAVPQVSVNVRDSQPTLPHPPISQLSTAEQ